MRPGSSLVWLVEIEVPGDRTFYLATEPITLTNAAGLGVCYDGGLSSVRFDESIDLLTVEPANPTADIEGYLPESLPHLAARGIDLGECSAVLSWVEVYRGTPVQSWEGRKRVAQGRLDSPGRADPTKADTWFATTIQCEIGDFSGPLIDRSFVIREDDFPIVALAPNDGPLYGTMMPLVIGAPGDLTNTFATPGYYLTYRPHPTNEVDVLIAGYDTEGTSVDVQDELGNEDTFPIHHGLTASGIPYTYVTIDTTGVGPHVSSASNQYLVKWSTASGVSEVSNGAFGGSVADVILFLLRRSGAKLNIGRSAAALQRLRAVSFAVYLNDPNTTAWEYLAKVILPTLPIAMRVSPDGLVLVYLDPTLPEGMEAATIDIEASGWLIQGAIISERPEFISAVRVQAGLNASLAWMSTEYQTDRGEGNIYAAKNDIRAKASDRETSTVVTLDLPWGQDETSAQFVAGAYLALRTGAKLTVEYTAPLDYAFIDVGDTVRITHASARLTNTPGIVTRKSWAGASWVFTVILFPGVKT